MRPSRIASRHSSRMSPAVSSEKIAVPKAPPAIVKRSPHETPEHRIRLSDMSGRRDSRLSSTSRTELCG
jgi:hypothetical protein